MSNNIVKHSQLHDVAGDLWTKAKKRDITALEYEATTKTIKGKNPDNPSLTISAQLTDLVSINDRAEFKKDVSVDDAKTVSNSNIGNINGPVTAGSRTTGYRGLTSKLFTDGYVKLLRVHLPSNAGSTIKAHVWAIKKGDSKTEDKHIKKIFQNATVQTAGTNKYIDVDINETFANETFFVLRTEGSQQIQGINQIKPEFINDIINVNDSFNPSSTTDNISWNNFDPRTDLVGHMELHGRTGIVDISKRLDEINTASGNYVLQSETTTTSEANKVVRLGRDGKINANMMPSIAINEYFTANDFTNAALSGLTYQNGDVVVVTKNGKTTRYLCVNKTDGANSTDHFVPLDSKDGIVTKVNNIAPATDGNVTVTAENIKYNADANAKTVKAVLDEKVSNIVLHVTDKKKLTVTKADGQTSDVDLTEAFKANNVTYGKQIAGATKATVDAALDALNEEVNKGVKSIKNGRPDAQGNIDVAISEGGATGITMTFGTTGGTPVKIATYMTTAEVNEIKALFV